MNEPNADHVLAKIPRGDDEELRVSWSKYKGATFMNLRVWSKATGEWRPIAGKGVTVNSVSPGYVKTEMTDAIPEDVRNSIIQQVPMGRMAMPDEIAYVVSFLTDDRNNYMTGANLPVNGGMYMI